MKLVIIDIKLDLLLMVQIEILKFSRICYNRSVQCDTILSSIMLLWNEYLYQNLRFEFCENQRV